MIKPSFPSIILPPEGQAYLIRFRKYLQSAFASAVALHRRVQRQNLPLPLVRWALRLLKEGDYVLVPSDKSHSFVAVTCCNYMVMLHSCLDNQRLYKKVSDMSLVDQRLLSPQYTALARRVKQYLEDPNAMRELCNSLQVPGASPIARLKFNVKDHKPPGQVCTRPIHASTPYAYHGLASWLARELRNELLKFPHIVWDTAQAIDSIRKVNLLPPGSFLVKIDIKDFFLSGSPDELVRDVLHHLPDSVYQRLLKDILHFLLHTQFVRVVGADLLFQCVSGSGMGLVHSGAVAETALLNRADRSMFDQTLLAQHGISLALRYRDDVLICGTDKVLFRKWFWEYQDLAGYFRTCLEEFSSCSVNWLDIGRHCQGWIFELRALSEANYIGQATVRGFPSLPPYTHVVAVAIDYALACPQLFKPLAHAWKDFVWLVIQMPWNPEHHKATTTRPLACEWCYITTRLCKSQWKDA